MELFSHFYLQAWMYVSITLKKKKEKNQLFATREDEFQYQHKMAPRDKTQDNRQCIKLYRSFLSHNMDCYA